MNMAMTANPRSRVQPMSRKKNSVRNESHPTFVINACTHRKAVTGIDMIRKV